MFHIEVGFRCLFLVAFGMDASKVAVDKRSDLDSSFSSDLGLFIRFNQPLLALNDASIVQLVVTFWSIEDRFLL